MFSLEGLKILVLLNVKKIQDSETASIHKQLWKSLAAYFGKPEKIKYLSIQQWHDSCFR